MPTYPPSRRYVMESTLKVFLDNLRADLAAIFPTVYVKNYSAPENNTGDASIGWQAALDALPASGGIVQGVRGATYRMLSGIDSYGRKNVYFDLNGSTMTKPVTSDYTAFKATARGGGGYGSSCEGLWIMNGTLKGSFLDGAVTGISISLLKAKKVRVINMRFVECMVGGHPMDLGGCDDVEALYCTFEGFRPGVGREYVEAVSLDWATLRGVGLEPAGSAVYDGTPCRNIKVRFCNFIPMTYAVNGVMYPAPNPFGCHDRVEGMVHDGAIFEWNYVEGAPQTSKDPTGAALQGFSSLMRGWIHFTQTKNIRIRYNTFKNIGSAAVVVVNGVTIQTALPVSQAGSSSGASQTTTPIPNHDWEVHGNRFIDFNSSQDTESLMTFGGHATGPTYAYGVKVGKNYYVNCNPTANPAALTSYSDAGSIAARFYYCAGPILEEQQGDKIRVIGQWDYCIDLFAESSRFDYVTSDPFRLYNCSGMHVNQNIMPNTGGGIHSVDSTKLWAYGNDQKLISGMTAPARPSHYALSNVQGFWIKDGNAEGAVTYGVNLYSGTANGKVRDMRIVGATTSPVNGAPASVEVSGTMTA